ncbi:MAG: hydroxyacid dehydrogenase, partial [Marinilabiliales bacterium]
MKITLIEPIGLSKEEMEQISNNLKDLGHSFTVYDTKPEKEEEVIKRAKDAEILVLSNLPISEEIISSCKNLKMISVAFAGVDHIAMDLCRKRNIIVSNAAGYSNHAVAELT